MNPSLNGNLHHRRIDPLRVRDLIHGLKGKHWGQYRAIMKVSLDQVYFTFVQLIPTILILGVVSGIIVVFQGLAQSDIFGGGAQVGTLWVWGIFRLGSTLISSVLILSRSATAVASETAVMKLSQEIESLEIMGIPALEFVFLPRIIGGGLSSFCANIIFLTAAFLGSFFMLNLRTSFSLWEFFLQMAHPLNRAEIFIFFAKSIISGLGIFWIACNHGLSLHLGRHEVPVRIVSGVVSGLKFILILELFSLFLYYGVY